MEILVRGDREWKRKESAKKEYGANYVPLKVGRKKRVDSGLAIVHWRQGESNGGSRREERTPELRRVGRV